MYTMLTHDIIAVLERIGYRTTSLPDGDYGPRVYVNGERESIINTLYLTQPIERVIGKMVVKMKNGQWYEFKTVGEGTVIEESVC